MKRVFVGVGLDTGLNGLGDIELIETYAKKHNCFIGVWSDGNGLFIEPSVTYKRNDVTDSFLMSEHSKEMAYLCADIVRYKKVRDLKKFIETISTQTNEGASLFFKGGRWHMVILNNLEFITNTNYKG